MTAAIHADFLNLLNLPHITVQLRGRDAGMSGSICPYAMVVKLKTARARVRRTPVTIHI
jgi:hypothetical protein